MYQYIFFRSGDGKFQMHNVMKSVKENAKAKHSRFIKLVILNCRGMADIEIIFYVACIRLIKAKQMAHIHIAQVNYQCQVNAA